VALVLCMIVVLVTVAISSSRLFRKYEVEDLLEYAHGINTLVADEIDPSKVDEYLREGHNAPGYDEILARLYRLREAFPDVEYLYVYKIEPDGCHVVFDLDTDSVRAGRFDVSFALSRDVSYSDDLCQILCYAIDNAKTTGAHGTDESFSAPGRPSSFRKSVWVSPAFSASSRTTAP
jgi:hypothetical protein